LYNLNDQSRVPFIPILAVVLANHISLSSGTYIGTANVETMEKNVVGGVEALASASLIGADREVVAVIGFALKYPQDVTSEESLWKLLLQRRSTMTNVPSNRWNLDGFYKPYGHRPGTVRILTVSVSLAN
jgi:hypothetical protein